MSGFRIVRDAQAFSKAPKRPKGSGKNADYLAWIRTLPCAVTGRHPVEAAHLSTANPQYGHFGRGKSQKAPDRWALPLHADEHRKQHGMNEYRYWLDARINPYPLALALHGVWSDHGEEATPFALLILQHARGTP